VSPSRRSYLHHHHRQGHGDGQGQGRGHQQGQGRGSVAGAPSTSTPSSTSTSTSTMPVRSSIVDAVAGSVGNGNGNGNNKNTNANSLQVHGDGLITFNDITVKKEGTKIYLEQASAEERSKIGKMTVAAPPDRVVAPKRKLLKYMDAHEILMQVGVVGGAGTKDKDGASAAAAAAAAEESRSSSSIIGGVVRKIGNIFGISREKTEMSTPSSSSPNQKKKKNDTKSKAGLPPILQWLIQNNDKHKQKQKKEKNLSSDAATNNDLRDREEESFSFWIMTKFVDRCLIDYWAAKSSKSGPSRNRDDTNRMATEVIDKILTSTPRLLIIINLLLSVTYLVHSIVINIFLGPANTRAGTGGGIGDTDMFSGDREMMGGMEGVGASSSERINRSGRERLGGYLLFKLLLITAVVEPDTLDLLILLSWYTFLAFLRSLSYLAGITNAHTAASGQSPHRGVLNLLMVVLICDISAVVVCAALFHGAGWGMVFLLACDCGLLALDSLTHLARFLQQTLEEKHQDMITHIETRQIQLHEDRRSEIRVGRSEEQVVSTTNDENILISDRSEGDDELRDLSRQLDYEMEILNAVHSKRLNFLENAAFGLELFGLILTICHFIHVWILHGVSLNLVDGVLALHLHSALSAVGKKISERQNHNRIVRDLDKYFKDATDMELMKATAAGDVCCICLCTMTLGNVKKVSCGHLYHTQCLREVVERSRSIEVARCPLCRASVLDGTPNNASNNQNEMSPQGIFFGAGLGINNQTEPAVDPVVPNNVGTQNTNDPRETGPINNAQPAANDQVPRQNERALFRLSTEGILPMWLPIPAFSFEVVRRFPAGGSEGDVPRESQTRHAQGAQNQASDVQNQLPDPQVGQQQNRQQSFWRRLLVFSGFVPMSPEDENDAISQLVDMFPQYNRSDLLAELRNRRSVERVVETILTGNFSGVARGSNTSTGMGNNIQNDNLTSGEQQTVQVSE